jgi:hypothetical protein
VKAQKIEIKIIYKYIFLNLVWFTECLASG